MDKKTTPGTLICIALAVAYVTTKFLAVRGLWFNGIEYWQRLWRPFPDWGTGAELYGALLAAKWNGTRAFMYGMVLLAVLFFGLLYKRYRFLGLILIEGAAVEALNLLWVAIGKQRGWSTPHSDSFMLQAALWTVALTAAGLYCYRTPEPAGAPTAAGFSPLSERAQRRLMYWCYFTAVGFVGMKWGFAYYWLFDTGKIWGVAFRMYPDWGTGAELYGAVLAAKWISTSNFWYGVIILVGIYFSYKRREHQLLAFLLLQGSFIEFFDGMWIANGKYNMGWYASRWGDVSMTGGFAWVPFLLFSGIYLMGNPQPLLRGQTPVRAGARSGAADEGRAAHPAVRPV